MALLPPAAEVPAMSRTGPRGEASSKESPGTRQSTIADKLNEQKEKYGPETLAVLSPRHCTYRDYMQRFMECHGSPNYAHSGICVMQKMFGYPYTVGSMGGANYPRPTTSTPIRDDLGHAPDVLGQSEGQLKRLLDCKARGAKLIVIKPTMEPDVAKADIWMPIRPRTDAALALAMLNVTSTRTSTTTRSSTSGATGSTSWCRTCSSTRPSGRSQSPACQHRRSRTSPECTPPRNRPASSRQRDRRDRTRTTRYGQWPS